MTTSDLKSSFFKVMLFLTVVTLAISLTILFIPLFEWSLNWLNIPEKVRMSRETIMDNYRVLLEYLHFPWVDQLAMPDFPSSASGVFHFYEVKRLFYLNYFILFISAPCSIYYLFKLKNDNQLYRLKTPSLIAALIPIGLLIFLAVNFDYMFLLFHKLLFDNDAWIFNPATDPIINVLTQEFFMLCFIMAFLIIEVLFLAGYWVGRRDLKQKIKSR